MRSINTVHCTDYVGSDNVLFVSAAAHALLQHWVLKMATRQSGRGRGRGRGDRPPAAAHTGSAAAGGGRRTAGGGQLVVDGLAGRPSDASLRSPLLVCSDSFSSARSAQLSSARLSSIRLALGSHSTARNTPRYGGTAQQTSPGEHKQQH